MEILFMVNKLDDGKRERRYPEEYRWLFINFFGLEKSDNCDKLCFVCARKRTLKIKACLVQEIQQNETNRIAAA